ncbi:hypothetical protein AHF37_02242 [Paragonimus kellicotti]|nr:hypothetical protein AHF37_02242 [Paragonimus kellicotti]
MSVSTFVQDAHNCEPEFDRSRYASLFAVYDGHGGAEVARYCATYLPEFLQKLPAYDKGDPAEALKQLFLDFDASLTTPEARAILQSLTEKDDAAGDNLASDSNEDEDESDSEISALRAEANQPLESVLERLWGEDVFFSSIKVSTHLMIWSCILGLSVGCESTSAAIHLNRREGYF